MYKCSLLQVCLFPSVWFKASTNDFFQMIYLYAGYFLNYSLKNDKTLSEPKATSLDCFFYTVSGIKMIYAYYFCQFKVIFKKIVGSFSVERYKHICPCMCDKEKQQSPYTGEKSWERFTCFD